MSNSKIFLVPPQILQFDFGDEVVNSGDFITVQCAIIKGDFPIKITWLHGDKDAAKTTGISIAQVNKRVSSLSIESVDAVHRGNYSCIAVNQAGISRVSAVLNINGTC